MGAIAGIAASPGLLLTIGKLYTGLAFAVLSARAEAVIAARPAAAVACASLAPRTGRSGPFCGPPRRGNALRLDVRLARLASSLALLRLGTSMRSGGVGAAACIGAPELAFPGVCAIPTRAQCHSARARAAVRLSPRRARLPGLAGLAGNSACLSGASLRSFHASVEASGGPAAARGGGVKRRFR